MCTALDFQEIKSELQKIYSTFCWWLILQGLSIEKAWDISRMCNRTIGIEAIIEGSVTQQMSDFSKTSEFTATDATMHYAAPKFNAPHSGGASSSETALGCFTAFQYCTRRSLTFWQCNIIQCNVLHCSFNTSFMRNAMDFHSMHCTAWNCTRLLHIAFQSITFQPSALCCSSSS